MFYALLDKVWWLVSIIVICAVLVGGYTMTFVKSVYSSNASLYILTTSTSITSLADIQLGTQLTKDYVVLAKSRPVVEKVIEDMKLTMTYNEFVGSVSITNPSDTRVLTLSVDNHDAYLAKQIVDYWAEVVAERVAQIMETDSPNIVETGVVATYPTSPSIKKNTMLGALLGAFVTCGVIVVMFLMNDSIKSADDIERVLGLNMLAAIPLEDGVTKKKYNAQRRRYDRRKKKLKREKKKQQAAS